MATEDDLKRRIEELTAENKDLVRRASRDARTITQLERLLAQNDKMQQASERVNTNLYNELMRVTQELAAQTNRVNELLLNVLPAVIKDELTARGHVASRAYEEATVLFSDFVGFTAFCERSTAIQVVERLSAYFSAFDEITSRLSLEKLKTVGDGYMCVGGVPTARESHALDCVRAGLEFIRATQVINERYGSLGEPGFSIRVGIHTGPVVGGVIGTRKFAFDIWGDTVNTAARVQAIGVTDGVTISEATFARVQGAVDCDDIGSVAAKGKSAELRRYHVKKVR
ncbi:MAG TPA: adenylate/guanylate cyclase domain-containing protein [Polyangiaceae bacterium]|jgi:class 3 adenylate cyclase|nr:adenylate/guanylate cyclase domain-containing protein [Polyangiaceae bacterium]